ncbi:hypothetical protein HJ588_18355 [Flexivirga sp. ID2601S]|uniref:Uncharacterized protein n=1 Tax=Flexivirga aerilata TaxID=1656889 RepID=A0A849ALE9_9MICO|nr:hypothetical protein [Flexivirga aerilata]NNG41225.1 hypothetical protein [Flexivirga aerilata]
MGWDDWLNSIDDALAPPTVPQDKGKPTDVAFEVTEPLSPHRSARERRKPAEADHDE